MLRRGMLMSEKYTGDDRRYTGEVDITYNLKRCIHAEHCVRHLSSVFDKAKRPWINPDGAPVELVASVIEQCPSGALHYERKDGVNEPILERNIIKLRRNGSLEIRGDLAVYGTTVELQHETRVTLCRCGASNNKPFCDNTHKAIAFQAVETDLHVEALPQSTGGQLTITVHTNASLEVQGKFEIVDEMGKTIYVGDSAWLCRCGGSSNKPFCDSTHKRNGFIGE
jgi:CDGSH-type Zn-finger protein/uncharacterized Fe-S cluster protein YjdI